MKDACVQTHGDWEPIPESSNEHEYLISPDPDYVIKGIQHMSTRLAPLEGDGCLQVALDAIAASGARTEGRLAAAAASMAAAAAPVAAAVQAASGENRRTRNTAAVEAAVAAEAAAAVAAATEGTCATDTLITNADSS